MEMEKLKKTICGDKNISEKILKQFSTKLTEETTNASVVSDLSKLIPVVYKYAVHEDKKFREAALPALEELAGLLDLNKHLKEKPWWKLMKEAILKSVDVLMNLVSTGDDQWAPLWITIVMMLGSDLRSELQLLNRLLKVVEKAFKMNDEEVRHQGFECWCKLIDNFSINKNEINNKRKLALLVIPLKANNHNTPRLCASKMKTWRHLLSKLDQHNEMTVELLVTHFLEFMFSGVGSIAPACKTLNVECANIFAQMLQTPLLFRILPKLFIKHVFVCIEHVHRDLTLCMSIWEGLLDNIKNNQWLEDHISELMVHILNAAKSEKLSRSKTFAHMVRALYSGGHALPNNILIKHLKTVLSLALEPYVLVNYTEEWCNELLNLVAETDPIQLPQNIVGDIIAKLNVLAVSELFRDEKLKFLRGMWMTMTNIICKWMTDDGQIGKNGNEETDLQNIHQLLFFGAAPLSSTWNKLQMKSWKTLYSECVKYFSLSTEVKCEQFVSDLVELLLEGVKDKKIPLHVALDLVSIILEFHLTKDESSILPLMMEVAVSVMNSFQSDTAGASALLNQYLKIILVAARSEPALVNDIFTVINKMLESLEDAPLLGSHLEKTRNAILKAQIQLNALKPCRSQDRSESPGTSSLPPASSPTMTSFMHRLAKSKETKSKVSSPTPSQSSDVSSSPSHTPNSKKVSSPFCDMESKDFVFVPPKPRKILLTDHQKESLTTRKHDIPALYQDLSQDSSQSPFESIVTPVHAGDKEQKIEKETTLRSPQSFKEVNFRNLSPQKSPITSSSSAVEDKLQNNKENNCVRNSNKKSPSKSNAQEIKVSEVADEAPFKILQEDQTRKQDHVSETGISRVTSGNTRVRSRKSVASDTSTGSNKGWSDVKENAKISTSEPHFDDDMKKIYNKVTKEDEPLNRGEHNIDQSSPITNHIDMTLAKKTKDDGVTTPKNSAIEVKTPKRSLRKTKLSISVEKSGRKIGQRNKSQEENEKDKSNSSSSSVTTPKVSPRRLRKRKSGVTPVLGVGQFSKKVRKSQSPISSTDTPTNKSVEKDGTAVNANNSDSRKNNTSVIVEAHKLCDEEVSNKSEDIKKPTLGSVADQIRKSTPKDTHTNIITKSNLEDSDKKSDVLENKDDEIEVITIIEVKDGNKSTVGNETKINDCECKCKSSKSFKTHINNVPCIDISCSPVKVVVERLPEVLICASQFEIQEGVKSSTESIRNVDQKKRASVRNITPSLKDNNQDMNSNNVGLSCNIKSSNSNVVKEATRTSLNLLDAISLRLDETCIEKGKQESKEGLHDKIQPINEGSENKKSENDKPLSGKVHLESAHLSPLSRKTIAMDKTGTCVNTENCIGEAKSISALEDGKGLESNKNEQDSSVIKSTPVKKKSCLASLNFPSVSDSKSTESTNSPSASSKPKSSENTPIKSGQKQLKQTQLPFTPVPKTLVSKPDPCSGSKSSQENHSEPSSRSDEKEGTLPLLVLVKMGTSEINQALHSPKSVSENENKTVEEYKSIQDSHTIKTGSNEEQCNQQSPANKISETRQEVQRTPEKGSSSKQLSICIQETEIELIEKTKKQSPDKNMESEDIIASSQETNASTQSLLLSFRNSSSNNSLKLLSKSPKKLETSLQAINSCDRVLRSSPSKTEKSRSTVTPIKKSVCRRLDIEIEESDSNDIDSLPNNTEVKSCTDENSEELSDDFNLLNGDSKSNKNLETQSIPSSRISEMVNNVEDAQNDCSPRSHKSLKRFIVETDASSVCSPKRIMGSLRFESNVSPISSPNSRTSQMMELAKQETEKTLSSPMGSAKRRRILPVRVGPVTRTPKSHIIQRTHTGPSEEWVRRTYSPMASPNSSILKRTQQSCLVSPDSSPPSSKKKRVSFLDPPVSESLLFSKAIPGKGQIQRPEPVQDTESEELPSQGSVGVEVEETTNSKAKVFSPLKQCSSPLTDILERIVNPLWMSELEAQLERLGVTTVGQLSSLPEETIQRLPFIPPKLERLRKILQNYYNEINEKSDDTRLTCSEKILLSGKDNAELLMKSPEKAVEDPELQSGETLSSKSPGKDGSEVLIKSPEKAIEDPKLQSGETTSLESPEKYGSEVLIKSPEKASEDPKLQSGETTSLESPEKYGSEVPVLIKSPEKAIEDSKLRSGETISSQSSDEDISSIAENIKTKLEQYPELISELGNRLHIDVVMKLLDFSVCKLKSEKYMS